MSTFNNNSNWSGCLRIFFGVIFEPLFIIGVIRKYYDLGLFISFLVNFEFCESANYWESYRQKYTAVSNLLVTFLLVGGFAKFKLCQKAYKELLIMASSFWANSCQSCSGSWITDTLTNNMVLISQSIIQIIYSSWIK